LLQTRPGVLGGAARIEVSPLSEDASRTLAARLLGAKADAALVADVAARSGGNPLVAEEMARAFADARDAASMPSGEGPLAAVAARFSRLVIEDRRALSRLAVLGPAFPAAATEAVGVKSDEIDALVSKGLIAAEERRGERELRFV